jgi:hypothetical protein
MVLVSYCSNLLFARFVLHSIERKAVRWLFASREQISSVSYIFKHWEDVPATLAYSALIRIAEITDMPLLLTADIGFRIYRRHGRQMSPSRDCWRSCYLCEGLRSLPVGTRHFEQALRADRPPQDLCFATSNSLPATQGQR